MLNVVVEAADGAVRTIYGEGAAETD